MVKKLRAMRIEKGITQQTLANAIGVSQQAINKYEHTSTEPDIETLRRMADFFETSVDYLVGHTEISRKIEVVAEYGLNYDEIEIVNQYRSVGSHEKVFIRQVLGFTVSRKSGAAAEDPEAPEEQNV